MNANRAGLIFFCLALMCAVHVDLNLSPTWKEQRYLHPVEQTETGRVFAHYQGVRVELRDLVDYRDSPLNQAKLDASDTRPALIEQWVVDVDGQIFLLKPSVHFRWWSLLPAVVAIGLCLLTREPIPALLGGIVVGAVIMGRYDITDKVLQPSLASDSAAFILLLYLWLLGGLMGVWSKSGAAQAFADHMTQHYVKGPVSAKLVTWLLGVLFFQGGTVSTVLVGTTVKPLADKAKVSHEEMSYIVDSTASPIASVLAFNAWPAYVQALIFVPGVAFLATEADRISFFFSSIIFSFYGVLAVLGTFLLSLNITWHCGRRIRAARERAMQTGQLDAPNAQPMSAKELHHALVPEGYTPKATEFVLPLLSLMTVAIGTFVYYGTPKVNWAFALAFMLACAMALSRGMSLRALTDGIGNGFKGVVVASVVLLLAITLGGISKETGGGLFLIDLLGNEIPYWLLPFILQLLTMLIAFSTGTSWGTYAIAFPLAMPLAWAVCEGQTLANPQIYMAICFATVLNGSVYGDQCSPISDTTILSAMTTGCDLMDHVKSQIIPATYAALLATGLWTVCTLLFA